jgi:hypothetical protein
MTRPRAQSPAKSRSELRADERAKTIRKRRSRGNLVLECLENRTLLSVTASLSSGVLDVNLSAANDQALITPSGSTISISGTNFSVQSFSGVTALLVQGANTSSQDDPNQSVTFGGTGGTIALDAASGTDALSVSGVTSVTFTDVTIDATSGNVDVEASETTAPTGDVASSTPQVAISVSGATIKADNVTLNATASSSYTYSSLGSLDSIGVAFATADLEPSATVTVTGSATNIAVNKTSGNVTIAANSSATFNASITVGTSFLGNALNPVDAAIAESIANTSAVAQVVGGSTVSAGSGTGTLSISSTNTTTVTTDVDGSAAVGGATGAVTLDNSTSEALVAGGSTATGGTVDVLATTTNTANTSATSMATGAGTNSAIQNILAGKVDPGYLASATPSNPNPADKSSPADTAFSAGLPLGVAGSVAVTKFTPTTQAYVDSSTVTAGNAINIDASSNNNASTTADGDSTTSNANSSVGVGVAISDTDASNTATIESTTGKTQLSAPTINVQTATPGTPSPTPNVLSTAASATAGASGTSVGLAGALALNIVSNTSEACVPSGSTVSMDGNVAFNAQDSATETTIAQPPVGFAGGTGGGALGVGAAVALTIATNSTLADLQNTAQLTGADNLTFTAGSTDVVSTNAVSGSSGGSMSISPSVGISVVNNTTEAQVGTPGANNTLSVSGAFSATATHTAQTSTAVGADSAAGGTASVGASIALGFVTDQTTATTDRSITATGGGVTFEADGSAASVVSSIASASGGPTNTQESGETDSGPADGSEAASGSDTADPNSVDGENAQARDFADNESNVTDSKGNSVSAGNTKSDAKTPAASTSDGSVTVAAAVAVNIVSSTADATIPSGLTITANGPLIVNANNDTGDPANVVSGDSANAWGTDAGTAEVGVGAAVALNLVSASAQATIGASTINADGVTVNAGMLLPSPMNVFLALAVSGAGATDIGVAGAVAIDIINNTSNALIDSNASVTANGGDVSVTSLNNATVTTLAQPAGAATGTSLGLGASLALSIVTDTTSAEIENGAALTNAGNVTVTAESTQAILTWGQNGAAGGTGVGAGIGAGIAIVIASAPTTALIGSDPETLNASGNVTIGTSGSFSVNSLADAATSGGAVGVGASVVVNVSQDTFLAELDRNVTAGGAIAVTDAATASSQAAAIGSEEGASPTGTDSSSGSNGTADQETQNQSSYAHSEGGSDSPDVAAPPTSNSELTSPSSSASSQSGGSTGATKVGIAAAVSVNVITTSTIAEIEGGLTVTAGGSLTVGTTNQSSALSLGDASATKNTDSIGAAVSLNVASVTNTATVGLGDTINAAGVSVTALMPNANQANDFSTQALGAAIGIQAGVAGSAGINVITITTEASIVGSYSTLGLNGGDTATIVNSSGGLTVQAVNNETLQNIAFTVAVGSTAGVGAAIDVNVINNTTNAFIGANIEANASDATQVTANSSLTPSDDPVPNSPSDTIIASGTLTKGSADVASIDGSILGVLGGDAFTPFKGEPVTGTGVPVGTVITETHNTPFVGILTFGSNVVASDDPVFVNPSDVLIVPKKGDTVSGPGILPGTTILSVTTNALATVITLSLPVIGNGASPLIASDLVLSRDATASGPTTLVETLTSDPIADLALAVSSLPASAPHPTNFAAGLGASSGGAGIAGSFIVNVIAQNTDAYINSGTTLNAQVGTTGYPTANADESVTVSANETMTIVDWAGAFGAGGDIGAGAALDVNIVNESDLAYIAASAKVDAAQNVEVTASTNGNFQSITAAASMAESTAIDGAASIEVISPTTEAYIGVGATVNAGGDVLVEASRQAAIDTIAGEVGVGGEVSVGAAVSTVVDTVITEADIDANDQITAHGASGTIPVLTGSAPGTTTPFSGVAVVAATFQNLQTIVVGGNASTEVGVAGSASVNVISDTTLAYVDNGAKLNENFGTAGSGTGVMVTAADPLTLQSTAGSLAASVSDNANVDVGIGVDVDSITKTTQAYIGTADVLANGDVLVQALSAENLASTSASLVAAINVNPDELGASAAIAGSAAVYVLNITTQAYIGSDSTTTSSGSTNVLADGSILVAATETNTLTLISGDFAGAAATVGTADTVPYIKKTTQAFIGAGAVVTALGLGSAINADTGQFAISDVPYGTTSSGQVEPMSVSANPSSLTDQDNNNLTSEQLTEQRVATPETTPVHGLAVTAVNSDDLEGVDVDGSVSFVGANVTTSVGVITNNTDAIIGSNAQVNASTAGAASGQSVLVAAGNDTSFLGIATAIKFAAAGLTPGAVVVVINNTTIASIDDGASVNALGDVMVGAHSSGDVLTIALGVADSAGLTASASYVGVTDTTQANIGDSANSYAAGANVNAGGNVLVDATDVTDAYLITGAFGVSVAGVAGGAISIVDLTKNTDAFIGDFATVNALGKTAGLSNIYDGETTGGFETLSSFHGVAVQAYSSENVINVSLAGAAGFMAGLAGGVSIELFNSNTHAYINTGALINVNSAGASSAQAVDVAAVNQASNFSFAGGLAFVGGADLAGAVDVGLLQNSTQAFIANDATVDAQQNVGVYALSNDKVQTYAVGVSGAKILGLVGSVSVWSIGEPYSASYTDGSTTDGTVQSLQKSDLTNSSSNAESATGLTSSLLGVFTSPTNTTLPGNSKYSTGAASLGESELSSAIGTDPVETAVNATPADSPPTGTVAYIGSGVTVNAGGNVNVVANSDVSYTGTVGSVGAGLLVGAGGSVDIANIGGSTQAYIDAKSTISAGGIVTVEADLVSDNVNGTAFGGDAGIVGIGAQVVDIQDTSTESAALNTDVLVKNGVTTYSGVAIPQAQGVLVTASSNRTLTATAEGGEGGVLAAGASVAIANATGGPSATIGSALIGQSGSASDTVGAVSVTATSADTINASADGVAAGIGIAATGVYAEAVSAPNVMAYVGNDAEITSTGNVVVEADDTPYTNAQALGVAAAGDVAVGVVISQATSSGVTSSTLGTGDSMLAPSLLVDANRSQDLNDDPTAQSSATAGTGGVLVSADATSSTATSAGGVTASTGSGSTIQAALPFFGTLTSGSPTVTDISSTAGLVVGQLVSGTAIPAGTTITSIVASTPTTPGSITLSAPVTTGGTGQMLIASGDLGDIAIEVTNSSLQNASATGVAVSGLLAIGLDFAAANSTVSTQAQLGADMITDITGTIAVSAAGTDDNLASSTAGSGGLIAGDASVTNTTDNSTTSATVDGGFLTGANVLVGANNNSVYTTDANSVNAAVAGFSGAVATNTDNTEASATVSNNTAIIASFAVDITAQNTFTETVPLFADSVSAGSGGVLNGTAAVSSSTLIGNADVTIGSDVLISVQTITPPSTGTSGIFVTASSLLNTNDQVSLSSGGLFEGAGTNSSLSATLTNSVTTNSSEADPDTFTTNENIGIGTYTTVDATTTSEASTGGVAAAASASAETDVTSTQSVMLGQYTDLLATQNINVTAGDGTIPGSTTATTMAGFSNAESYARAFVAIPAAHATTTLTSIATLTVSANDLIESGEDTTLAADHGTPEATAQGIGHGYELGFIPVTDGKSSPSTKTSSNVTINGTVEAGATHELDITIPNDNSVGDANGDSQDLSVNGGAAVVAGSPSDPTTVTTLSTVAFTASFDPSFNPDSTIQAAAADGDLPDVGEATALEDGVFNGEIGAMVLGPLFAAGGDVTVNAGTLNGSGTVAAYGGPSITITNDSPDYLVLSSINIPNEPGGQVIYTGTQTSAPSTLNVTQSGAGNRPIVTIQEQYDNSVPSGSSNGPSVFATATLNSDGSVTLDSSGSINNVGGQVAITVADGSFIQAGGINANQVNITTANGILALTNPSGLSGNAGTPASTVDQLMYWPGGFNPYAPGGSSPSDLASVYVAYVANAMYNSSGEYTTDQAFSAALLGFAGQIPDSDAPGSENDFQFPTSLGAKESGTSLIFFGADEPWSSSADQDSTATATAASPAGGFYLFSKDSNNGGANDFQGIFPAVPVLTVPTIQESIPTLDTVSISGTLTAGSTSVAGPSSTAGLIPGESVTGTGIAPGTTINQVGSVTFTAGVSSDNDGDVIGVASDVQLAVGETLTGVGIPAGTTIVEIILDGDLGGNLVLSNPVAANPNGSETVTASFLTLSAAATLTGTESLTMSGFSAINADEVFISAKYVDINEPINVGQPNNWSVSLPAALNSTIQADQSIYNSSISFTLTKGTDQATVPANEIGSLTVGDGVSGAGIPSGTTITAIDSTTDKVTLSSNATEAGTQSISVWLFTLPASAISAGDMAIPAQYDAITQQIIVSSVSAASGGFIELNGQIMSTNTLGEITVNSDVGQVTIDNQTSYPIVVNNVSASTSTASSTLSGVDIIDTNLPAATEQTLYVYNPGGVIDEYQGTASLSPQQLEAGSPFNAVQGNSISYSPETGLLWQWQLQTTMEQSSLQTGDIATAGWTADTVDVPGTTASNPWYYLTTPNGTAADGTITPTGWTTVDTSVPDSDIPDFQETISGAVLEDLNTGGEFQTNGHFGFATTEPADIVDGVTIDPWTFEYATEAELTLTLSIKADNPIGINFSGPAQAGVSITSDTPVILDGNITNPLGNTTITASSITQTASATITSNNLTLDATGGVGTASQPLAASLTANGVLNVQAGSQGVYLNLGSGALLGVIDSGGDVVLNATGSLDPASGLPGGTVNVIGNNLTLNSATGEVGTAAAPLVIQASEVVNVTALLDIGLTQPDGSLQVNQIVSTSGNVTIDVPNGSILNDSGTTWSAEVDDDASQAIWQNLGLTTSATSSSSPVQQAITAFQNEVDATYAAYWQLIDNGSVENGVFTLNSDELAIYAAQAGAALNISDPTDADIQSYANTQYQTHVAFFNQNLASNWTSSADFQTFNPDFSYQATATQIANFENNATWTNEALTFTVAQVAVDPEAGTPVGISTPNIAGANVTLVTGGSIGKIGTSTSIPASAFESSDLSSGDETALADASATDDVIVVTGTGISVTPTEQIFISATGDVNASAAGSIIIQGTSPDLTLSQITAGGAVNLSAQESILGSGTGTQITTPGNTVLKAGTGTVGSPTTPLDVNVGGQLAVYTPPGNIFIVGSQTTKLSVSANTGSTSTYGESVTFTATISDTNTGTGTPTGNVEFYDGSTNLGAGTLLSSSGTSATWTFTTSTLTVGAQSISADFTPSGNSVGSSGSLSLTVSPAALTITAESTSKTYGQTATFAGTSFTETGLVNGDTITAVAETSDGAAVSATVGTYNIVPLAAAGTDLSDYTITYVDGTLTVNKAKLTVTANSTSKTYGQTATFGTATFTETGLVTANGDTITGVTETSAGAPISATVGNYNIVPSAATGTGLGNYTITYVNGTLTVNPAPLTITDTESKTYGTLKTFSGTVFTEAGLVTANGDTITGVTETSTGAPVSAIVGTYPIVVSAATGTGLGNYTITYVNGTLTVNPASLIITANNASKTYGTLATFSTTAFTETGLVTVNSDTISGVTETSTGAPVSATVGNYNIVPSAATGTGLANYIISYVNGTLTVNPATTSTVVISSANPSVYGQPVTFTATVTNTSVGSIPVPTGTVQFIVDGTDFGAPMPVTATGQEISLPDAFLSGASHTVKAVYTNIDGDFIGSASTTLTQTLQQVAIEPDPSNPTLTDLFIGSNGATSNDTFLVNPAGKSSTGSTGVNVQAMLNGVFTQTTYPESFSSIDIFLQNGNDDVQFATSLTMNAMITAGNGNDFVLAGNGNAAVSLGSGNDTVQLGNGADTVTLGGRNDYVSAGNGNDTVSAGSGNDTVQLGSGADVITLGAGNDYVSAGNGNDTVTISAGTHSDIVQLGNGNDTVTAGSGNDTVQLGGGTDVITLSAGNDYVSAGNGNDTVTAGSGNDTVQLGGGSDTIQLGDGNDFVSAGNGTDNVTTGNGNDTIQLGNGSDVIIEGNGNDFVSAGDGADLVVAGLGQHTVQLGNGNDILIDGSATVVNSGDSFRQILSDWNSSSSASVDTRIKVVYNTSHPNVLKAGIGRNWWFYTYSKDVTNRKSSDRLN